MLMSKRPREILTKLELEIMQVIWRLGEANVAAVQAGLDRELAYTTVQTMLNILERKGKLKRQLQGRAFLYSATVSESKASGHALKDFIDRVFAGSSEDLVMSLLKHNQIDAKKLAKIARRLEKGGDA
jgi:predicted transcriptional regulator